MSSVKDAIRSLPTGLSCFNPLRNICVLVHTHVGREGRRDGERGLDIAWKVQQHQLYHKYRVFLHKKKLREQNWRLYLMEKTFSLSSLLGFGESLIDKWFIQSPAKYLFFRCLPLMDSEIILFDNLVGQVSCVCETAKCPFGDNSVYILLSFLIQKMCIGCHSLGIRALSASGVLILSDTLSYFLPKHIWSSK